MLDVNDSTSPADIASQIGDELFPKDDGSNLPGKGENSGEGEIPADPAKAKVSDTTVFDANSGKEIPGNPQPQQAKPLHKSWKKDMEPHWAKLDPAVQEYVYAREADVMRGIQQYQEGHNKWGEVLSPFKDVMSRYPDVNPVPLLQNLMQSHLALISAAPEKKLELATRLLKAYNIELPSNSGQEPNQELISVKKELQDLKEGFTQSQRAVYEAGVAEKTKLVEAFFADPKNKYAEEVGEDILRFLSTGAAKDLSGAYDLAIWANPAVRAKMLADQQANPAPGQLNGKPQPTNITESGAANTRPRKNATWQDDVDSIVKTHYGTH